LAKSNLSQVAFADLVGLGKVTVSKWKKNEEFPQWVQGWLEGYIAKIKLNEYVSAFNNLKE